MPLGLVASHLRVTEDEVRDLSEQGFLPEIIDEGGSPHFRWSVVEPMLRDIHCYYALRYHAGYEVPDLSYGGPRSGAAMFAEGMCTFWRFVMWACAFVFVVSVAKSILESQQGAS